MRTVVASFLSFASIALAVGCAGRSPEEQGTQGAAEIVDNHTTSEATTTVTIYGDPARTLSKAFAIPWHGFTSSDHSLQIKCTFVTGYSGCTITTTRPAMDDESITDYGTYTGYTTTQKIEWSAATAKELSEVLTTQHVYDGDYNYDLHGGSRVFSLLCQEGVCTFSRQQSYFQDGPPVPPCVGGVCGGELMCRMTSGTEASPPHMACLFR